MVKLSSCIQPYHSLDNVTLAQCMEAFYVGDHEFHASFTHCDVLKAKRAAHDHLGFNVWHVALLGVKRWEPSLHSEMRIVENNSRDIVERGEERKH